MPPQRRRRQQRVGGGDLVIAYSVVKAAKENSNFGEKYETTAKVPNPAAPVTAEQYTTTTITSKSPPMAPRLNNDTSANSIGIRLLSHITNMCERNHHHNRRQRGVMAGAPMFFATPTAASTAAVDPSLASTSTTEPMMAGLADLKLFNTLLLL